MRKSGEGEGEEAACRSRRRGQPQRREAEQHGVAEEVEQLQHQDERLRQDHAVAHRREPHGCRSPRTLQATNKEKSQHGGEIGGKEGKKRGGGG